ncbi:MAG: phosphoesterase [Pirellulaceae bacterium]|nr:phosphoesterase [Pirellulaceae bacterium]
MVSATEEHILVVPEPVIAEIGEVDGFESDVDRFLGPILASDQLSFQPRGVMETDPSFKQLIPYVLLEWTDDDGSVMLFTYTRGGGSGETRLHAKRSVGIGGHISKEDAADGADPYTTGMQRELAEEIKLDSGYQETREGLIYDPSNEVGQVHLGVVHRFVLESPHVESNEADLAEGGFVAIDQLKEELDRLETWSQLAIKALYLQ